MDGIDFPKDMETYVDYGMTSGNPSIRCVDSFRSIACYARRSVGIDRQPVNERSRTFWGHPPTSRQC